MTISVTRLLFAALAGSLLCLYPHRVSAHVPSVSAPELSFQDEKPDLNPEDQQRKDEWAKKQQERIKEEALKARLKRILENAQGADPAKALKEIDEVLAENADLAEIFYYKGLCLVQLKKLDEAKKAFRTEIERNPKSVNSKFELAKIASSGEAKELLEELLATDPSHQDALKLLANIYIDQSDFQKAEKYLQNSMKLAPDNASGYLVLGDLYRMNINDSKKAGANYAEFLKRSGQAGMTRSIVDLLIKTLTEDKYEFGLVEDRISCVKNIGGDTSGNFTETKTGKLIKDAKTEYIFKSHEGKEVKLSKTGSWGKADLKIGEKTGFASALDEYFASIGRISGVSDETLMEKTDAMIASVADSKPPCKKANDAFSSFLNDYMTMLQDKGSDESREKLTLLFESQGFKTLYFGCWIKNKDWELVELCSAINAARGEDLRKIARRIVDTKLPQAPICAGYAFLAGGDVEASIKKFREFIKFSDDETTNKNLEDICKTLDKVVPCKKCGGTNKVPCTKCRGTGVIVCATCRGDGIVEFPSLGGGVERKPCTKCKGTPKQDCQTCKTEKTVKCPQCDEPLQDKLKRYEPLLKRVVCQTCKGKNYIEGAFCTLCDSCYGLGFILQPDEKNLGK